MLVAVFVLVVLLVSPRADFPLNDDWVYAKAVRTLLNEGVYKGHPYMLANPVVHIYAGAAIAKVWGFSYDGLRVWTLILGLIAAWATARSGREYGLGLLSAFLCGLLVMLNPIILNLSYTFMTDVPFLCFTSLAGLFFLKSFKECGARYVLVGTIFAVLAYMTRQFGLLLSAAYFATALVFWVRRIYKVTWPKVFALVVPWVCVFAVMPIINAHREVGTSLSFESPGLGIVVATLRLIAVCLCYYGLFASPLVVAILLVRLFGDHGRRRGVLVWCSLFFLGFMCLYWYKGVERMPTFLPNMIYDFGVGPVAVLPGMGWLGPLQIGRVWWLLTFWGAGAGAVLLYVMLGKLGPVLQVGVRGECRQGCAGATSADIVKQQMDCFLICWASAVILALMNPWMGGHINNRYIMPAFIPVVIMAAGAAQLERHRWVGRIALVGTVLVGALSIACLQDYLAWNRARWCATDKLTHEQNVPVESIQGGFEFNGECLSDRFMAAYDTGDFCEQGPYGYFALSDEYIVTMLKEKEGYKQVFGVPYFSWLGMKERFINVLKRVYPET